MGMQFTIEEILGCKYALFVVYCHYAQGGFRNIAGIGRKAFLSCDDVPAGTEFGGDCFILR